MKKTKLTKKIILASVAVFTLTLGGLAGWSFGWTDIGYLDVYNLTQSFGYWVLAFFLSAIIVLLTKIVLDQMWPNDKSK